LVLRRPKYSFQTTGIIKNIYTAPQTKQRTARRTKKGGIDETMILLNRHDATILAKSAIEPGAPSFFNADMHDGESSSKEKFIKKPEKYTPKKILHGERRDQSANTSVLVGRSDRRRRARNEQPPDYRSQLH